VSTFKLSNYDRQTLEYLDMAGVGGELLQRVEKAIRVNEVVGHDSDVMAELIVFLEDDFKKEDSVPVADVLKFLKDHGVQW
jgi:hypothetical protein